MRNQSAQRIKSTHTAWGAWIYMRHLYRTREAMLCRSGPFESIHEACARQSLAETTVCPCMSPTKKNKNQPKPSAKRTREEERREGRGRKREKTKRRREPKLLPSSREALGLGKQREFRERDGFREGPI